MCVLLFQCKFILKLWFLWFFARAAAKRTHHIKVLMVCVCVYVCVRCWKASVCACTCDSERYARIIWKWRRD